MGDACVVCGESAEGKPLYKKLGSGEYNVEVLAALRALQLTIITDADKNNGYICWDCDEVIVAEYGRYLESEESKKTEDVKQRRTKKHHKAETKKKKSKPPDIHKGKKIRKLKLSLSRISLESTAVPRPVTKAKKQEHHKVRKISKVHQSSHCVMCDKSFENGDRGYQRFNLMKMVNDDMDVAEVMQLLGLARHIAPEMKKKRFVCNPCYYIIRRNYKNKLLKGTSIEAVASSGATNSKPPQNPIHRATTQEHAAEIAKLLPPALAECYKILTGDSDMTEKEVLPPVDTSQQQNITGHLLSENQKNSQRFETGSADDEVYTENDGDEHSAGTEAEDEDSGFNVSQDKFGNYVINMDEVASPGLDDDQTAESKSPLPTMSKDMHINRKKNVLLPKRRQHHLSMEQDSEGSQPESDSQSLPVKDVNGTQSTTGGEDGSLTGVCNICGIKFTGKPTTWWYSLNSLLAGFENITVTIALRLLETSLAATSKEARIARQVCPMCYGMVSAGFRSQVTQRVEQQLHVDPSQVNISKMKVQTIPRPKLKNTNEKEVVPTQSQKYVNEDINNIKRQKRKSIEDSSELSKAKKTKDESMVENRIPRRGKNVVRINKRGRKRKPIGKVQEQTNRIQELSVDKDSDADDSKPPKPIVLLEDLRSVLPAEVFGGKPVSALKIEGNINQSSPSHNSEESATTCHSELAGSSPPASHLIFSSLTPSQEIGPYESIHHADKEIFTNKLDKSKGNIVPGNVRGRCVICGCNYYVEQTFWKNISTMIRPPSLMISLRWVCISLNVTPVEVSVRDQELGKVCKYCFGRLGKQFESFVKSKVGESSGIPAKDVKLKDYIITFNPDTMNIEADPVRPQKREQDEMTRLLKRILRVMESFSIDDLVSKPQRQPLEMQEFSIWMLLVLNDFRVQIGAAIGDLAKWLTQLMPNELYDKGLRPCQSKLAHYLLTLSKYSSNMDNNEMSNTVPDEIFIVINLPELIAQEKIGSAQSVSSKSNIKKKIDSEFDKVNEGGSKSENIIDSISRQEQPSTTDDGSGKAEIHWEDFLRQTSLDELMEGTAKPLSLAQFSNGVIYSLWRTSLMIGGGSETFRGWLMQIAPILLDHEQTEKIISGVKALHDHLEKQPEDVCKLGIQVIPFLRPGMMLRVDGQVSEYTTGTEVDDPDTSEFNILGSLSTNCSRTIPNAKSNGKAKSRNPSVPTLDDKYCEETRNISDSRGANRLSLSSAVRRNRVKKKTRGSSDVKVVAGTSILNSPEKSLPESDQSSKEGNQVTEEGREKKRNLLKSGITSRVDFNHITGSSLESVSMKISSHVNSTKLKETHEDAGKNGSQLCLASDSKSDNKIAKAKDKSSQLNNTDSDKVKSNTITNDNEKSTVHVENSKASPYRAKVKRKLSTDDVTVKVGRSDGNSKASLHERGSVPGMGKCLGKPHNLEVPRLPGKPVQGRKRVKLQQSRGKAHVKQVEKLEKQMSVDHKTKRNSGEDHSKHKGGELSQGNANRKIEQESISKKPKSTEVPETQKHLAKRQNQPSRLSKSGVFSSSKDLSSSVGQRSRRLAGTPALSVEEIDTKEKAKKAKPTFEDLMSYDT